jgi:mono/diheme cytochrome c family protein
MTSVTARALMALLLVGLLMVAGCGGDDEQEPPATDQPPAETPAEEPAEEPDGRALFTEQAAPPCASCHTLADADATGTVGVNLDERQPDADEVEQAIRTGPGAMPAYEDLTDEQVSAIADYVSGAAGD